MDHKASVRERVWAELKKVAVPDEVTAEKIAAFMEKIEEDDDVVEVHTNADL